MVLEEDRMKTSTRIFLILLLLRITEAKAQQTTLPYLREVRIKSTIGFDPVKGIYSYSYSIRNGETSNGAIDWFEIDVSRDTLSEVLNDIDLQFKNSRIEDAYRRMYSRIVNRVVPISFPNLPQYGDGALSIMGTAVLSATVIQSGQEAHGFVVSSKGIPRIRSFVARPLFDPSDFYPSVDQVSNPDSLADEIDRDREAVKFRGLTIGPTAPPANFVATAFLDTLLSYARQSAQLGWLGRNRDDDCDDDERPDDGVVRNIENRLQKARRELVRRDSVKARRELEKLVRKVDRLQRRGKRVMTSEAYALLKYNTEYVIERLPERRRR